MDSGNYRRLISSSSSRRWRLRLSSWLPSLVVLLIIQRTTVATYDRYEYYVDYEEPSTLESVTEEGTTQTYSLPETTEITTTEMLDEILTTTEVVNGNNFYCQEDLCLQYDLSGQLVPKRHVACGHEGTFAEDCPPGRTLFKIDPQIRAFIIHLHNEARNRMANGSMEGFEAASRMPTVVWDDELAKLAELNAKSCKFKHDECRNTDQYRQAGQNLALGYYPLEENIFDVVEKLTTLWFNEYKDATQTVMDEFENPPNKTIGHFTQMMSDRTTSIGCGIVIYPQKISGYTFKVVLYACNYSLTNIFGQSVYRKGQVAANCAYGVNPYYEGLCTAEENQFIRSVPFYED